MSKKLACIFTYLIMATATFSSVLSAQESTDNSQSDTTSEKSATPVTPSNQSQNPPDATPVDPAKIEAQAKAASLARGEGPAACREQCRLRSVIGTPMWMSFADFNGPGQEAMLKIWQEDLNTCPNACSKELTAEACTACAIRTIPDEKIEKDKAAVAKYNCSDKTKWNGRDCTLYAQVEIDPVVPAAVKEAFRKQSQAQQQAQQAEHEKNKPTIALRYADDEARKAADMEQQVQAAYQKLFSSIPEPTREQVIQGWNPSPELEKANQDAMNMSMKALQHKQQEFLYREYAAGRPFNPNRNWCVSACQNRMPFDGVKVSNKSGWMNMAMTVAKYVGGKAILECVRACSAKSDSECDACAREQIDDNIQKELRDDIAQNWGCDRELEGPAPSIGQIIGVQIFHMLTGALEGGFCAIIGNPQLQFPTDWSKSLGDPAKLVK